MLIGTHINFHFLCLKLSYMLPGLHEEFKQREIQNKLNPSSQSQRNEVKVFSMVMTDEHNFKLRPDLTLVQHLGSLSRG